MHGRYFLLAAILVAQVFGQTGVILRGGANLANVGFNPKLPPSADQSMRAGMEVGGMFDFTIQDALHLLMGVGYENRGFKASTWGDEAVFKFDYVVIPAMISLRSPSLDSLSGRKPVFFMNTGGEAAILTSANLEWRDESGSVKKDMKGSDFALRGEAGFEFPVSNSGAFLLGAGYVLGLKNVFRSNSEGKSRVLKLFVGYKFGFPAAGMEGRALPPPLWPPQQYE